MACNDKESLVKQLIVLLNNKNYRYEKTKLAIKRMGKHGASKNIIEYIDLNL